MVEVFLNHHRTFLALTEFWLLEISYKLAVIPVYRDAFTVIPSMESPQMRYTFCGDFFTFFLFVLFNLLVYGAMSVLFSM